jgi:hypothetical protein
MLRCQWHTGQLTLRVTPFKADTDHIAQGNGTGIGTGLGTLNPPLNDRDYLRIYSESNL